MDLTTATALYNTIMLGIVGLNIFWFCQRPGWRRFFVGVGCIVASGFLLAMLAAGNPLRAARLLCFGWFVQLPVFLVWAAVWCWASQRRLSCLALGTVLVIALVAVDSFWIEPFWLEITRVQVPSGKLQQPLRVAVLADFQTDVFGQYQRESLVALMQQQPDVIVMAGDYLQSRSQDGWEALRDQMRSCLEEIDFGAPLGVYAVGGNTDFQRWPEIFEGFCVTTFQTTQTVETERLRITGLSVEDSFDTKLDLPTHPNVDDSKFHIVLGHAPNFALSDVSADLLAAGHTHGGQVRLPGIGPLVTFSAIPRSWASGVTQIEGGRILAVARGIGMERRDAPRMRFLCRPQLLIIDFVPQGEIDYESPLTSNVPSASSAFLKIAVDAATWSGARTPTTK